MANRINLPTYTIAGVTSPISVSFSDSHDSPTASMTVECTSTTLDIGDDIELYLGYSGVNTRLFKGYVKQVERKIPSNTYTLVCNNVMVRATDYFIVAADPNEPYKRQNIAAETVVQELMAMAQLTDYTFDPTFFVFAVSSGVFVEVNQTTVFDYCRNIADTITWHLWADMNGQVHFENRKPYVMTGTTDQPGDDTDERFGAYVTDYTLTDDLVLDIAYSKDEKNLRNRVVVYGANGMHAEAKLESPYLPADFYKTAVLEATALLDQQSYVDDTAEYNLDLFNRLTETMNVTVLGDPLLQARKIITVDSDIVTMSGNWYVFSVEHSISKEGYTTAMTLRGLTI